MNRSALGACLAVLSPLAVVIVVGGRSDFVPRAVADVRAANDPAGDNTDPDGDATPLDIRSLTAGHRQNPSTPVEPPELTLRVEMHEAWSNDVLRDDQHFFSFHIRVNRAPCINRVIDVEVTDDGSLFAEMLGGCSGPARFFGYAKVWRPNDRTLKLSFPKSMLGKDPRRFGVRVLTANTGGDCQRPSGDSNEPCEDVAPDDHLLVHRLQ